MIKPISHCASRAVVFALSLTLLAVGLTLPDQVVAQTQQATMCALPGKDGGGNASGVVNDYFGGTAGTLNAGASSVTLGARDGRGPGRQMQTGDLLLFIQMQDASISISNNANYGGSGSGSGSTNVGNSGRYEFVRVTTVSGNTVSFSPALTYSYVSAVATTTQGKRSYQIVRVPQYTDVAIAGVEAPAWNGATGGVVAIDASGTLTLNGATVEGQANRAIYAAGRGFRGGFGVTTTGTDNTVPFVSTSNANGAKGEGIAGSPLQMLNPVPFNGTANDTALTSIAGDGYPAGNRGKGAPGNAGGGGSEGTSSGTANNDKNAGGGGGGNHAPGGIGGRPWNASTVDGGGRGGAGYRNVLSFSRLFMGGGGGAGGSNNSTGDNNTYASNSGRACSAGAAKCSSGASGGGIVILRAERFAGTGVIDVRGAHAYNVNQDAGGGGGAAGSVALFAATGAANTLSIQAQGGDGGNAWAGRSTTTPVADRHGPGGGGGGGFIVYNPATMGVVANVAGGIPGRSTNGADTYGADGHQGGAAAFGTPTVPGVNPGALCEPVISLSKSNNANTVAANSPAEYELVVKNSGSLATQGQIKIVDVLPANVTAANGALALTGAQAANWNCQSSANVISCTSGTVIAAKAESRFSLTVQIGDIETGSVMNKAKIGGGGSPLPEPTPTEVAACTATNQPAGCAVDTDAVNTPLLKLIKTDNKELVAQGGSSAYTLSVSNIGSAPTTDVIRIVDVLPAGMTATQTSFNQADFACTVSAQVMTCERPADKPLAINDVVNLNVTVQISATATGQLTNKAQVGGGGDPSKPDLPTETTVNQCPVPIAPASSASSQATGCASDSNTVQTVKLNFIKDDTTVTMPATGQVIYNFSVSNSSTVDSVNTIYFRDVLPTTTPGSFRWSNPLQITGVNANDWSCTRVNNKETSCQTKSGVVVKAGETNRFSLMAVTDGLTNGHQWENKGRISGGGDPELLTTAPTTAQVNGCNGSSPAGCSTDLNTVVDEARVLLTKAHADPQAKKIGDQVVFTLTVTNTGSAATVDNNQLKVVDVLPAGLTYVSATGSNYSCSHSNQIVTCTSTNPTLNSGASRSITISATVANNVNNSGGDLINRAQVGSTATATTVRECAENRQPYMGCAVDNVPLLADLAILKRQRLAGGSFQSTALEVVQGQTVEFELVVSNGSNAVNLQNVSFSDVLPSAYSAISVVSTTPGNGVQNCQASANGNTVRGAIGTLPRNSSCTVVISAQAKSAGIATNTATVDVPSGVSDPTPGDNSSTVTTAIQTPAKFSLAKALIAESGSEAGVAEAGETLSYRIRISNAGSAKGVIDVVDVLGAGLRFVSANPAATVSGSTLTWSQVAVPGNGSVDLLVDAQVASPIALESVGNSVKEANTAAPACPSAQCVVTPTASSDLQIVKAVDKPAPMVGESVRFTLTVTNNGSSAATGVVVNEQLPGGYELVSATPSAGSYANDVWTVGTVADKASATLTITAKVLAAGAYANTATVAGNERDPDSDNNTSTSTPAPLASADLSVTKTTDNEAPKVGENVTFTLKVTNHGLSDASGVIVAEQLPSGYEFVAANTATGTYTNGAWAVGALANQASATLSVTAKVLASGDYKNTATVSATEHDPDPDNNSSSSTPVPVAAADLGLTKVVDKEKPKVGESVTFTLTVTNYGLSAASDVEVAEQLPSGYELLSATASVGSYANDVWAVGTLANQATATLTISAKVLATGDYNNTATVAATEHDPNPDNNTSSSTPVPDAAADLSVVKTVTPTAPKVGDNVSFTVTVKNNGLSEATGVQVTDALPDGYAFVSAAAPNGTSYDQTLWNIGNLSNGQAVSLTVVAKVLASGNYKNTANVAANEHDPEPDNNTSSSTPVPEASADVAITKTVDNDKPKVGETITFTLIVINNGLSDASNVNVAEQLPSGYQLLGAQPSVGTFTNNVWAIGALASQATATLEIQAKVLASGNYRNTVTVSAKEFDPQLDNNSADSTPVPEPSADLAITKTVDKARPKVGEVVRFTLTVTNNGLSQATGVTVSEQLPDGYALVDAAPEQGVFSNSVWSVGTLAAQASKSMVVQARVLADGNYANTVTVTATEHDPDPSNNSSTSTPVPEASADLTVLKTVNNAAPKVGENITFSIKVKNNGLSAASGVELVDTLPDGYAFVSATAPNGTTYDQTRWNIGNLAQGAEITLTVVAKVLASGNYTNTATVSATEHDPNPSDNSSSSTPTPVAAADLAVTKVASSETPKVGENVSFTITVSNNGLSDATGVSVAEKLPSGYALVSASSSIGSYANDVWRVGDLASGARETLTVVATVLAAGSYSNTATVSGNEHDPTPGNNSATSTPQPEASADLSVTKTVDNAEPKVGDTVTFTVAVTNLGLSNASGVNVTEQLPNGYQLLSSTASSGNYNHQLWAIGNLANQAQATLVIVAKVLASGEYSNTASVTGNEHDPDPSNNSSTSTPVPEASADLTVLKTVNNAAPKVGENITFSIRVKNNGLSAASGVELVDALPDGYAFVSATAPNGTTYDQTRWNIGNLAQGAEITLTVVAKVLASGNYTNTATVSATEHDPNPSDNSSSSTPTPVAAADLAVTKVASSETPKVGENVSFTITVSNIGLSDATGVSVAEKLPSGYALVSASSSVGSYANDVWRVDDIASGARETLTVVATVLAAGSYSNTATVSGNEHDPTPGNNSATSTPQPEASADLSVTKTVDKAQPNVGDSVVFSVVVNNSGPSAASDVRVMEPLPSGYRLESVASTQGSYNSATGQWSIGTMANQASATLRLTVTVLAGGDYVNTATVTGKEHDSEPSNNSSSSTPSPAANADLSVRKTVNPSLAIVGDTVVFTLSANNAGPSAAANAQVVDPLPAGYQYVSDNGQGAYDAATGVWQLGSVASGDSRELQLRAKVVAGSAYTNRATISSDTPDLVPENNTSTSTPTVTQLPVISYGKQANPASGQTVSAGQIITYTLTVDVANTKVISPIVLTDTLGAGLELVDVSSAGVFTVDSGNSPTLKFTLRKETAPGSYSVSYRVRVIDSAIGSVNNNVTATGGGNPNDPQSPAPSCSGSCGTQHYLAQSAVSYSKQSNPASGAAVLASDTIEYTLSAVVSNSALLSDVVLTDTLDSKLSFAGVVTAGAYTHRDLGAGVHRFTLPAGTVPGTYKVSYRATIDALATGVVGNSVTGSGGGDPADPAPPQPVCGGVCETKHEIADPSITVEKSALPAADSKVAVGDVIEYAIKVAITSNANLPTLSDTVITDTLGTGLRFDGVVTNNTGFVVDDNAAPVVLITLPANTAPGVYTLRYRALVTALAVDQVTNNVTAAGGGNPNNPSYPDPSCAQCGVSHDVIEPVITTAKTSNPISGKSVGPGQTLEYTLTANISETDSLSEVVLTDTLADSLTYVAEVSNDGFIVDASAAPTYRFTLPSGKAPGAYSVTFRVKLSETATSSIRNEVLAAGGGNPNDPNALAPSCGATCSTTHPVHVVEANDDDFSATPINGKDGGDTLVPVTDNDRLNGDAVDPTEIATTVTTPATPAAPGAPVPELNTATGIVMVPPATPAGNYPITYQICEIVNPTNCDEAIVTVTVGKPVIVANDDDFSASPMNGKEGGSTTEPVTKNDTLNGKPIVTSEITSTVKTPATPAVPNAPVPVLDTATGIVNVPPATPAGDYTITYTLCEIVNPANCDDATVTVKVEPSPLAANDDTTSPINGKDGGETKVPVTRNDTLNGDPVDPADTTTTVKIPAEPIDPNGSNSNVPTLDPTTGLVTVPPNTPAGEYTIEYTLCERLNPANCDDATVTVVVEKSSIDAVDDSFSPINSKDGGNTASVLLNDQLNGKTVVPAEVLLAPGTSPNSKLQMHADGSISVAPETPAGSYDYPYTICEVLNPKNCDTAVATVAVEVAEVEALNDRYDTVNGKEGATTASVLLNDQLNGKTVVPAEVLLTPGTSPNSKLVMNSNGTITVAPETPAGSYDYPYTICEVLNPNNCDTAVATVVVEPAPIDAVDDTTAPINGKAGGTSVVPVTKNDTLNGEPVDPALTSTSVKTPAKPMDPVNPNTNVPTLDTSTGLVTVPPNTPAGSYTIEYTLCELLNPANCDDAIVTVVVETALIDAVDDATPAINGKQGGNTASVLDNDSLDGVKLVPADVTLTPGASPNTGLNMNPDGTITVQPGTPAGSYPYPYTLCEVLNPNNCDDAIATVVVEEAPIVAVDDSIPPINGKDGGISTVPIVNNDTLNGEPVEPNEIRTTVKTPAKPIDPANPNTTVPMLDPNDGLVTVPPNTPEGTYIIEYTLCELLNPANCDDATVTVVVQPAPINAVNDSFGPVNGVEGGSTPSVLFNDTLNGKTVVPAEIVLTEGASPHAGLMMNPDSTITVAPATPAGSYDYPYTICEVLNPSNCDTAIASVVVKAAPIVATDDTTSPINGKEGGTSTVPVTNNDRLNGKPIGPTETHTTVKVPAKPIDPANPNSNVPTLDSSDGLVTVPKNTPEGTYTIEYTLCEVLNPANCDDAIVTVVVSKAQIDALNDNFGALNGKVGGKTPSVLLNDRLNGELVVPADVILTEGVSPLPGQISMNPDGTITVSPETSAGSYLYPYTICEVLNPNNCDNAVATVVVEAAKIVASDDTIPPINGSEGGKSTVPVTTNDTLNGDLVDPADVTTTVKTPAKPLDPANPNTNVPTLDPSDGQVSVPPNTPEGSYTIEYTLCELLNPLNCAEAVVTIEVEAAVIDAVDDDLRSTPINGRDGGSTPTVFDKDSLDGKPVVAGEVTVIISPADAGELPGVAINSSTGVITVPVGTPAGEYDVTYRLCEVLNPLNCDDAVVTIKVEAAAIDATDDDFSATPINGKDGGKTPSVFDKDTLNSSDVVQGEVTVIISPNDAGELPGATIDVNTGEITVPAGTPAGEYEVIYRLCEVLNSLNCDDAVVTIKVDAPKIDAIDDDFSAAPINGKDGGKTPSVFDKDTLNSSDVVQGEVTVIISPNDAGELPDATIDANNGEITVPAGTPAGEYDVTYRLCEVLNPLNCDDAVVTIKVDAPKIDAIDDDFSAAPINGKDGGEIAASVIENDKLNDVILTPADIALTAGTSPLPDLITMNADGKITVKPATPAGSYLYPYTICEVTNPANCDDAVATVVVELAPIFAEDDTVPAINGKDGGSSVPVINNDTLNGDKVDLAETTITVKTPAIPADPANPDKVPTLEPSTGVVNVPPGTPEGTYTIVYTLCELLNRTNCDEATVTVVVEKSAIDAVDDSFSSVNGKEGTTTATVLVNDTLNNTPVLLADITLKPGTSPLDGQIGMNPDGTITVKPGTPADTYSYPYRICERLNPTNCDDAVAILVVTEAPIVAVDDGFDSVSGRNGGTTDSVLVNDTLGGKPVIPTEIELKPGNTPHAGLTMNGDGSITVAPGTPAGTYSYPYEICEVLNPANCDSAVATVDVSTTPIAAQDDPFDPVNGRDGGTTVSVLDNDKLDGKTIDTADITLTPDANPPAGLTMNPDGTITVPPGTPAGSYDYPYEICEVLNPDNCADAIATVEVTTSPIAAVDDDQTHVFISVAGGKGDIANILDNDTLNGSAIDINDITVTVDGSSHPGVTVDPATGLITVAPNTPAGEYTLTYTICERLNPTNCDTATVLVNVEGGSLMTVTKRADKTDVVTGDLVRYTIEAKNTSPQAIVDAILVDTPPAGFTLVLDSLMVKDRDGNWRLAGQSPIRLEALSVEAGDMVEVSYLLRVGPGAAARGEYKNTAQMQLNGKWISNQGSATVTRSADPLFEDTRILGTVFDDIDGDGWQDSAKATGITVQGGFAADAYVANSTRVDRGEGFAPEPDASSPLLHGIKLGTLEGRASEVEVLGKRRMVITQLLRQPAFTDDFVLETAEGQRYQMDAEGRVTRTEKGDAKAGLTAQDLEIERVVSAADNGLLRVDYVITNKGVNERGIPGVRLGTVEGLLVTTDAKGRYHLEGLKVEHLGRGQNFLIKVDASTLPKGTPFTTKNPLLKRITQGIPVRFDFGVQLPKQPLKKADVALELGEVLFAPNSAELKPEYSKAIAAMAAEINRQGGGLVDITGYGDKHALALERAANLQRALSAEVKPAYQDKLEFAIKGEQRLGGLDAERVVLADILFDTDKHTIKPEYQPMIARLTTIVKQRLADNNGVQQIAITGHTDHRAGRAYNYQLGLKRAQAVYDAVSQSLSADERARLRVTTAEVGQ